MMAAIVNYILCGVVVGLASFGTCFFVGIVLDALPRTTSRQNRQQGSNPLPTKQSSNSQWQGGAHQAAPPYNSGTNSINHRQLTDDELRELIKRSK